jgi:L-asparaginase II
MTAHPEMVSGEHGADLALARAGRGDWVSKIGAEGVRAMSIRSRGWGIAVKVADGNMRGLHAATIGVLDHLGLLDAAARASLARLASPTLRNLRGIVTGQIRTAVVLDKCGGGGRPDVTIPAQ